MSWLRGIPVILAGGLCCLLASCAAPDAGLQARLQDEDPQVRLAAVVEAGQTHDRKAAALLVERLNDGESDVRFFAILSLEKITGMTMGYRYYDPQPKRDQAVAQWRQWLLTGKMPPAEKSSVSLTLRPAPASQPSSQPAAGPARGTSS